MLWDQDLHRVRMEESEESDNDQFPTAEASRRLEIFLDYLLSSTRDTAHLLVGDRFDSVLSPGERRLRDALRQFMSALIDDDRGSVQNTVAWPKIERLLISLGFDEK